MPAHPSISIQANFPVEAFRRTRAWAEHHWDGRWGTNAPRGRGACPRRPTGAPTYGGCPLSRRAPAAPSSGKTALGPVRQKRRPQVRGAEDPRSRVGTQSTTFDQFRTWGRRAPCFSATGHWSSASAGHRDPQGLGAGPPTRLCARSTGWNGSLDPRSLGELVGGGQDEC